jgi:hypothetical protein
MGTDGSYLLRVGCGWTFKIREKGSFVGVSDALLVICGVESAPEVDEAAKGSLASM